MKYMQHVRRDKLKTVRMRRIAVLAFVWCLVLASAVGASLTMSESSVAADQAETATASSTPAPATLALLAAGGALVLVKKSIRRLQQVRSHRK